MNCHAPPSHAGLYELSQYAFLADRTGGSGLTWSKLLDGGNNMIMVWVIFIIEWYCLPFDAYYIDQVSPTGELRACRSSARRRGAGRVLGLGCSLTGAATAAAGLRCREWGPAPPTLHVWRAVPRPADHEEAPLQVETQEAQGRGGITGQVGLADQLGLRDHGAPAATAAGGAAHAGWRCLEGQAPVCVCLFPRRARPCRWPAENR